MAFTHHKEQENKEEKTSETLTPIPSGLKGRYLYFSIVATVSLSYPQFVPRPKRPWISQLGFDLMGVL